MVAIWCRRRLQYVAHSVIKQSACFTDSFTVNSSSLSIPKMIYWVLPRFHGHLTKAHNGPGGCHDTATQVFSGVQA